MSEQTFDLVVLGAGSGGYAAALRASQLGLSVALVEKDKLGGTCLHVGCIPTKALLHSAEVADVTRESAKYGVTARFEGIDMNAVTKYREEVVTSKWKGLTGLVKHRRTELDTVRQAFVDERQQHRLDAVGPDQVADLVGRIDPQAADHRALRSGGIVDEGDRQIFGGLPQHLQQLPASGPGPIDHHPLFAAVLTVEHQFPKAEPDPAQRQKGKQSIDQRHRPRHRPRRNRRARGDQDVRRSRHRRARCR